MTTLGDRIAAAKRHPADLTYSEWVELLEDVEKELRWRDASIAAALEDIENGCHYDAEARLSAYLPGEPS